MGGRLIGFEFSASPTLNLTFNLTLIQTVTVTPTPTFVYWIDVKPFGLVQLTHIDHLFRQCIVHRMAKLLPINYKNYSQ